MSVESNAILEFDPVGNMNDFILEKTASYGNLSKCNSKLFPAIIMIFFNFNNERFFRKISQVIGNIAVQNVFN